MAQEYSKHFPSSGGVFFFFATFHESDGLKRCPCALHWRCQTWGWPAEGAIVAAADENYIRRAGLPGIMGSWRRGQLYSGLWIVDKSQHFSITVHSMLCILIIIFWCQVLRLCTYCFIERNGTYTLEGIQWPSKSILHLSLTGSPR